MPDPDHLDYAGLLARKAEDDAKVCAALVEDFGLRDDAIGFHAQQAVEKALKAVLVVQGVDFPHTHDLDYLVELATEHGVEVPESIGTVEWLTPWATGLRYDEPSTGLDRPAALATATAAAEWAKSRVAGTS